MANFLGNLGAVIQGQQNYKSWETQQEQAKLRVEAEKENLASIKDLAAQSKKQRARETDVAQGTLDYLQGIPIPPSQPPAVQPPPPGQQSQPMIDPNQAQVPYPQQQRSIGPQGPQGGLPPGMQLGQPPGPPQGPQGGPPQGFQPGPQQGFPQGPPQGQQGPQGTPQGPQGVPQGMQQGQPPGPPPGPPPIPPYQTVQGAQSGRPQQQGMQGIPPPPPQQPGQPRPNSMSIQDAAQFIKAQGIKDPVTSLQILDRLTPYLNNEAKQEAAQLKLQLDFSQKEAALKEKIRNDDLVSNNSQASTAERRAAAESANQTRLMLGQLNAGIAQQRVNNQTKSLQQKIESNTLDKDDLQNIAEQYWAGDRQALSGLARSPQSRIQAQKAITQWGKDHGKSGADLAQATAEFEGLKAGERALGTRTANVGLAVNEANLLSDLALQTSNEWTRSGIKSLNDLQKYAQGKTASPELRKFVAANNSFINAYARAISPSGAPTVSDKEHARETLDAGFSRGDYAATIDILRQEMQAAQQAPQATKKELRKLAMGEAAADSRTSPTSQGVVLPSSKAELKTGQIYQTARGPAKWNGTAFEAQ